MGFHGKILEIPVDFPVNQSIEPLHTFRTATWFPRYHLSSLRTERFRESLESSRSSSLVRKRLRDVQPEYIGIHNHESMLTNNNHDDDDVDDGLSIIIIIVVLGIYNS